MLWNTPLVSLTLTHAGHANKGGSNVASTTRVIPYNIAIAKEFSGPVQVGRGKKGRSRGRTQGNRFRSPFPPRDMCECTDRIIIQ